MVKAKSINFSARALKAQAHVKNLMKSWNVALINSSTTADQMKDPIDQSSNDSSSARPTRAQRATVFQNWKAARKPVFKKKGKVWTWPDVLGLCTAAQLTPHADAEAHWDEQTVKPINRKIQMADGSSPNLYHIHSGNTSGVQMTVEQKAALTARISSTRKKRGHGQTNWLEAAGIKAFCSLFETLFPGVLEFSALPDGLGADILVRRRDGNNNDQWAAVQVKTAKAHPGEMMSLNVKQIDGLRGGKYEHMILLSIGLDPACERPDSTATVFDTVADAVIKDIFVYQNTSQLPGKSLNPYPRRERSSPETRSVSQQNKQDAYGCNRYTAGVNTESDLQNIMTLFVQYVDAARKFTKHEAWFCPLLNRSVTKEHRFEVDNMKALAAVFGGVQYLSAPLAQNETVDVVLQLVNVNYRLSLKTASVNGCNAFRFNKKKAPNSHLCDAVMVFYIDRKTKERTHVSVISSKEVYNDKEKMFCWSKTNKVSVLKNRINLRDADAAQQIKKALEALIV